MSRQIRNQIFNLLEGSGEAMPILSNWIPQTLTVEAAEPTKVVMRGLAVNTTDVAGNFVIAGFTVTSLARDVTNKILTLTLSIPVIYTNTLNVVYLTNTYVVRNNVTPIYYVKNAGNDLLDGLTDATAWATLTKVNAVTFIAGDQICFNRGDIWRAQLTPKRPVDNSTAITYSSYGTGDNPIITGSNNITGFSTVGGNQWDAAVTTQPYVVVINGVRGILVASKAAVIAANQWFWTANVLTVYSASDPSGLVEAGARSRCVDTYVNLCSNLLFVDLLFEGANMFNGHMVYCRHTNLSKIKFYDCTFKNCAGWCLTFISSLAGMINCDVNGCTFTGTWQDAIFLDPGLTIDAVNDLDIINCDIYACGLRTSSEQNGIYGTLNGVLIQNCRIRDCGRMGGFLAHGVYHAASAGVCTIDHCTIYDNPQGSAIRARGGIIATNNTLYGNNYSAFNLNTNGAINADYVMINNLMYDNGSYGIMKGAWGTGVINVTIIHNTIVHTTGVEEAIMITSEPGTPTNNITIKNNIIYTLSEYCISNQIAPISKDVDYNMCFRQDNIWKYKWNNVGTQLFADWQALGMDANGYYADPVLTDVTDPTYDLRLTAGSPVGARTGGLVVAGHVTDYVGVAWGTTPSIGAYQYV